MMIVAEQLVEQLLPILEVCCSHPDIISHIGTEV